MNTEIKKRIKEIQAEIIGLHPEGIYDVGPGCIWIKSLVTHSRLVVREGRYLMKPYKDYNENGVLTDKPLSRKGTTLFLLIYKNGDVLLNVDGDARVNGGIEKVYSFTGHCDVLIDKLPVSVPAECVLLTHKEVETLVFNSDTSPEKAEKLIKGLTKGLEIAEENSISEDQLQYIVYPSGHVNIDYQE